MTKKKLLKILLIALAVLVVAGTVVGLWLGGVFGPKQTQTGGERPVYWNLERDEYVAAGADFGSGRAARPDGLYYITFGCNGEKMELTASRKDLVDKIDMMEAMCLDFDENGVISAVYPIEDYGYEMYARSLIVTQVEGNKVVANNGISLRGMDFELTLDDSIQIYNVSGGALLGYQPCTIAVNDELVVLKNAEGQISHIYVKPYRVPGDVYLNVNRMYNSTLKASTREPDALGYFTYEFAVNGEVKTFRCRDQQLANDIDKTNAPLMHLEFDEEGLISAKLSVNTVTGGKAVSSWYDVIDIDGNTFTTKRLLTGSGHGNTNEHVMASNCVIVNNTDAGNYKGELTDLRVGDRVHCLTDSRDNVCYILIVSRPFDGKIALNKTRKWDSTNKVSTRAPADDGYYYITMAIDGKEQVVKTKDKAIVDKLDSFFCYGVKLDENNEVIKVTSASKVYGGSVVASYYDVTAVDGNNITTKRILSGSSQGTVREVTLADDCQVYLQTDALGTFGEATQVQVGDRVHCFTSPDGKAQLIYVVNRPINGSIWWNMSRKYSSTKKETTRVPDADGWYWFDFAVDGKQVTLKTNQKSIANQIDSNATRQMCILHWKGQITKVVASASVRGCEGGPKGVSWVDITAANGNTYTARKYDTGKVYTFTIANNAKIWNVDPDGILKYVGEPTTLQVGDRVHAHHNVDGLATVVFVVDYRVAALDTEPNSCPCAQNVTWQPCDGIAPLEDGKSYYLTQDVVAPQEGFLLDGVKVNIRLDGHTISSPGRVFWVKGGVTLNICDHDTRGKLVGSGVSGEPGGVIRTTSGSYVNLFNIDVTSDGDHAEVPNEGGLISVSCSVTAQNVKFSGGHTSGKGGNIFVSTIGTFRAFDSTLENGVAGTQGGNLCVMNRIYLENTVLTGGAAADGDNYYHNTTKECLMDGVTLSAPGNGKNAYIKVGVLDLAGKVTIAKGSNYTVYINSGNMQDMGMTADSSLGVTRDGYGIAIANASQELMDCVTLENAVNQKLEYVNGDIRITSTIPPKPHSSHCLCVGGDLGMAEHTCTEITEWKELTLDELTVSELSSDRLMIKESGNYYLAYDMKLGATIDILNNQNITICLNGCTLESGSRGINVVGELNITDCDGTGKVVSNYAYNGGCIKLSNSGLFNLYAGTLSNKATAETGGAVVVVSTDALGGSYVNGTPGTKQETVFNMYGGKLSGGKTSGSGGNINLFHENCYFNMYGGVIENGTATNLGGNIRSNNEVQLLGGKITGGSASKGDDVYYYGGNLVLGGKLEIGQLTIPSGMTITIHAAGLTTAAPIQVVAGEGVFATNVQSDLSGCFKASGLDVVYDSEAKTLSLVAPTHDPHCVCNGADLGLANHTCAAISDWKPLTEACLTDAKTSSGSVTGLKFIEPGNYFLTGDFELTRPLYNQYNHEVTICLNGYTLSCPNNNVATVSGVLNITDCTGTGVCQGNSTSNGGCIRLARGGTLNIYAGTYRNSKAVATGGGVVVVSRDTWSATGGTTTNTANAATFNMYGGTLDGGKTTANGGNVTIFHTECTFNMYGGTITGGKADGNGGNLKSAGTMNLLGGTIKGGTAAKGDDFYFNSGTLTLGGKMDIGNITISGKTFKIADAGLTVTKPIELIASEGVFATNVKTDLSGCFKADGMKVVYSATDKTLSLAALGHPEHCVCNDADLGLASHTCKEITEWIPVSDACFTDALDSSNKVAGLKFKESGNYYLTGDYQLSAQLYVQYGQNITICLNGYKLTGNTRVGYVSGVLNMTDCIGTGSCVGNCNSNGGVLKVTRSGELNIYGGTYSNPTEVANGGGVICVSRDGSSAAGSTAALGTPNTGTFNFYGGTLTGGKTSGNGGTVTIFHAECTMNMYGGTIEKGTAVKNGGNLYGVGKVNLLGGTIKGGTAVKGTDVYIYNCTLTLGGTLDIGQINANGYKLKIHSSGLSVAAPIEIVSANATLATDVLSDLSACFKVSGKTVTYDATAKTLKAE